MDEHTTDRLIAEFRSLADKADERAQAHREKGEVYLAFSCRRLVYAYRHCANRLAKPVFADTPTEVWPMSKTPTCPRCGWPPMMDEETGHVGCEC